MGWVGAVTSNEVKFENGLTEFRIGMMPDGKIEGIGFRPL